MSFDLDLSDVLDLHRRSTVGHIHTAVPGIVKSYNASTQTGDVQPVNRRIFFDRDGNKREGPDPAIIPNVVFLWPSANNYGLHMPVTAGDEVLLVYSETSPADWYESGEVSTPSDTDRLTASHAFAIAGLNSSKNILGSLAQSDTMCMGKDDSNKQVVISDSGILVGKGVAGIVWTESGTTIGGPVTSGVATQLTQAALYAALTTQLTAMTAWMSAVDAAIAAIIPTVGTSDPPGGPLAAAVQSTGAALTAALAGTLTALALPTNFSQTVTAGS